MNKARFQALNYLLAPANAPWRWAEDGTVLVWRDGTTIAFRQEVAAVLQRLAPQGLVPFPAVALLLAACRGKIPKLPDIIGEPKPSSPGKDKLLRTARQQLAVQVEAMLAELAKVQQLPADLIGKMAAKSLLAEIVFEAAKVERHVAADEILEGLNGPFSDEELNPTAAAGWTVDQVAHLLMLSRGLKAYSPESLRLRMLTGLEGLPGAARLDLNPSEQARELLEQFSRDDELAGLARVARELMAAIRLPRRIHQPDQLAIGGVADISNRGPLDRLLLSELANDDLTLATRLALNEALYLRREPPAREPPATLAILLDSGVRLWGVPRVFAVAVALALVARERYHTRVSVWRAHGQKVLPVDLLSRRGLVTHLAELETDSNPAEALAAFGNRDQGRTADLDAVEDSILVTHRDTLDDPEFRRSLSLAPKHPGFIATVDRNGDFQLHAVPLARRPPISQASLNLESLFAEPKPATRILDRSRFPGLPLIFGMRPFPLLLPVTGRIERLQREGERTVCVTRDDRVLIWQGSSEGSLQIAAGIPRGKTIWMRGFPDGRIALLRSHGSQFHYLQADMRGSLETTTFPKIEPPSLILDEGEVLLLIGRKRTEVRSLHSGELVATVDNPPGISFDGRLCTSGKEWLCVRWNGEVPAWEPVSLPAGITFDEVLLLFYREGTEGPLVLTRMGEVYDCDGKRMFKAGREIQWARPSRDGHRILVNGMGQGESQVLDLKHQRIQLVISNPELILNPQTPVPFRQVRSRFGALHAREPGVITLFADKGTGLVIGPNARGGLEVRSKEKSGLRPSTCLGFKDVKVPKELGCQLQVAEWPNGSQAFLDSRGLLHLKSHDAAVAEVSLVLHEGEAAGWCSDGLTTGPHFFCPNRPSKPVELARRLALFFERLC